MNRRFIVVAQLVALLMSLMLIIATSTLAKKPEPLGKNPVFCRSRNGRLFERNVCKKRETQVSLSSLPGPPGSPGPKGDTGEQGLQGPQGLPGHDGIDGVCPKHCKNHKHDDDDKD